MVTMPPRHHFLKGKWGTFPRSVSCQTWARDWQQIASRCSTTQGWYRNPCFKIDGCTHVPPHLRGTHKDLIFLSFFLFWPIGESLQNYFFLQYQNDFIKSARFTAPFKVSKSFIFQRFIELVDLVPGIKRIQSTVGLAKV